MKAADENFIVAKLLKADAARPGDDLEMSTRANLPAFRSLARSRGIDLEQVLRAACRGELAEVVAIASVERRDDPPMRDDGTTCALLNSAL